MRTLALAPADALRLALLAALGLPAFAACGGTVQMKDDSSSDGGTTGSGGSHSTGGAVATGGLTGTGGAVGVGGAIGTRCTNPEPLLVGYDTGFYECAEGYEHRAEAKECPSFLPRAEPRPETPNTSGTGGAPSLDECHYDSECPGPHGYCTQQSGWEFPQGNVCAHGCVSDSDCPSGQLCRCGDPIGQCVSTAGANGAQGCTSDADCGDGLLCAYVPQIGCGSGVVFACQTPADECQSTADCTDGFQDCALSYEGTGQRLCQGAPVCGRPFLVDFLERRADAAERSDWTLSARAPGLTGLGETERARLAAHWTDVGLMEHASIAAFARFSLQLLSLGAPADLIEETNRALVDETKHARLCFALASSYRGAPVGPGALSVEGSLAGDSPETILRTVIREGCLGETQAALEAAEARSACQDPAVAEVLAVIAQDEARHAELAWRFVQWLLAEKPELRSVAREEFSAELATLAAAEPESEAGESLRRHGVLDAAARENIRRRALTAVLAPCAEGLLATRGEGKVTSVSARASRSAAVAALS